MLLIALVHIIIKNLFKSNFILPYTISEKLSKIDSYLENKLLFIHISTIAVNAPYMKNNLNSLPLMTLNKSEIKYNQYEFSKACGEVVIRKKILVVFKIYQLSFYNHQTSYLINHYF